MSKEKWMVGINVEPEERKHIQSVYEKFRIPHSKRALELMLKDVKDLEGKNDVLEGDNEQMPNLQ